MNINAEDALLPVGTILAYAGALPDLSNLGWLACDGKALSRGDYKELWDAIGTGFGSPSEQEFNVPALEGMFLRGVDHGSKRDPSADQRTPLRQGGHLGAQVGTMQAYGTAAPNNKFRAKLAGYKVEEGKYDKGAAARPYKWNSDKVEHLAQGGDKESRPINKYVHFIIKATGRTSTGRVVQPPIGAVMPFASMTNPDPARWTICDGSHQSTKGEWALLFGAIQFAHGETNEGEMVLPDYRGYFLRSVSGQSTVDPDADARTAPYPDGEEGKKGNAGNLVGSVQAFATGLPTSVPFTTTFVSLPKDKTDKDGIDGWVRYLVDAKTATTVSLTGEGGDLETRPWNVAIDWYIRAR